jgi:hypothetical protein
MNQHFGDLLRRELIQFIDRSELLRRRAESSGSRRLSSSSAALANDNKIPISGADFTWSDS